jgi:hypothetical protein
MLKIELQRQLCHYSLLALVLFVPYTEPAAWAGGGRGGGGGRSRGDSGPVPPTVQEPRTNPFAADAPPVEGSEARLDAMEKFVFDKRDKQLALV